MNPRDEDGDFFTIHSDDYHAGGITEVPKTVIVTNAGEDE